jgi:hypothetical protein
MRKLSLLLIGFLFFNVAKPSGAAAQRKAEQEAKEVKEEAEDLGKDVLKQLLSPKWNAYLSGGVTTTGRFLLQRPVNGGGGEQALRTNTGWNVGAGLGGDYLLRQGYRFYYQFSRNTLQFRTNNGDGSSNLDFDTDAHITSNIFGLDLIRYMLPSRAPITPYATIGAVGTWWSLDTSPLIQAAGGKTQFRMGANLAFGLQVRSWEQFGVRLEASHSTTGNPFTGKRSFRTVGAVTVDEPTTVGNWDYRLAGAYYFQKRGNLMKKIEKKAEEQP